MKFQLLIERKILENIYFLPFKLLHVVFFMLINVKMPTIDCWHFNIYEHDKVQAKLTQAWKKFYNLSGIVQSGNHWKHFYDWVGYGSQISSLIFVSAGQGLKLNTYIKETVIGGNRSNTMMALTNNHWFFFFKQIDLMNILH